MSELIAFLQTPEGVELTHAVIALLVAIAAVLSAYAARISHTNRKLLDGHLQAHLDEMGDQR